jgi:hypothetical protein
MCVPTCMAVLYEFSAIHSYYRRSVVHGGLRPPPYHSSHPNKVARIPPAMCDRPFGKSLPFCVAENEGEEQLVIASTNQIESYCI